MSENEFTDQPVPELSAHGSIDRLAALGPEAQGDIDETLLRENLALTPLQRLLAANEFVEQIGQLQRAMKAAGHA